jgi:hypothetical protein
MANPIAGTQPPGATGAGVNPFQNTLNQTMTPGYTGGFGTSNVYGNLIGSEDPNVRMFGALGQIQQFANQQAYEREESLFNRIQDMRKREAKEAYEMQLPFKVAGMVGNQVSTIFQNINQSIAPIKAYELAIRSRTPELIAQTVANNPFAGRQWLRS